MFYRILIAAVLVTGTLTGLAIPTASAQQTTDAAHRRYEVLYHHNGRWHVYGVYNHRHEAERAVHHLHHQGHRSAYIREL